MTQNRVTVTIELSSSQFQLLRSLAAKRSTPERIVKVHNLIEQLVDRALTPMSNTQYVIAHRDLSIRELHSAGLNDRAMARKLQCSSNTIWRARHRLGLAANDTRGGSHPNRGA